MPTCVRVLTARMLSGGQVARKIYCQNVCHLDERRLWCERRSPSGRVGMNLQGRVAIVTGGASSVGRSVCVELGRGGASIVAIDLDGDGLEQTATEIEFAGGAVE